jgi:hypothetical protein
MKVNSGKKDLRQTENCFQKTNVNSGRKKFNNWVIDDWEIEKFKMSNRETNAGNHPVIKSLNHQILAVPLRRARRIF